MKYFKACFVSILITIMMMMMMMKAKFILVASAPFLTTFLPSNQLLISMFLNSTLGTASPFSGDLLLLTIFVKGVNECFLDDNQVNRLSHHCVY